MFFSPLSSSDETDVPSARAIFVMAHVLAMGLIRDAAASCTMLCRGERRAPTVSGAG